MKILIDISSILGAFLYLTDEEYGLDITFEGNKFHIPDVETCMERFKVSLDNMLDGLGLSTTDIICVCDPSKPCRERRKLLPTYKEKEVESPPEFFECKKRLFTVAKDFLRNQGAIIATPKGTQEADDLINQLAVRLPKTIIWTRDKDLLACPTDVVLHGTDGPEFNPEKFPVPDKFIHVYRTLVLGDKSDNVSSCKGFGPKTWKDMVAKFGEDAIGDLDDMLRGECLYELQSYVHSFPRLQLILDQADHLYTTYQVMSFLPVPAHTIRWEGGALKGRDMLVTSDNYTEAMIIIQGTDFDYSVIDYETDVSDESREWSKTSTVFVDVKSSKICGMGLRIKDLNFYFCVDHKDTNNITLDQLEAVLEILYGKPVYAHNSTGFENVVTYTHFGTFLPHMYDTTIMGSYVDENDHTNLKHLSSRWLNFQQQTYADTVAGRSGMREVTGEEVVSYGIDDVVVTDGIRNLFTVIMQYENTLETFEKVEIDSGYFTSLCFINGVDFDDKAHAELKVKNDKLLEDTWDKLSQMLLDIGWEGGEYRPIKALNINEFKRAYKIIHKKDLPSSITATRTALKEITDTKLIELVGARDFDGLNAYAEPLWEPEAELNVRSPVQMNKLLYDVLGIKKRVINKPTKKMRKAGEPGNPKADEEAIKNAIAWKDTEHIELLETLLKYKDYLTKESLFLGKYPQFIHWETGKIHSSMRQSDATTRRFTHGKANLAQLPKKKGKVYRNLLKAPEGDWYIWALDIDSQELQLQAWASQDPNFLACYIGKEKKDVHSLTGFQVAAKQNTPFPTMEDFTSQLGDGEAAKPFRVLGKATNFATAYLCMAKRLSLMLCVSEDDAQAFMDAKDLAFPELLPAAMEYIELCAKRGYAETFLGARRHLGGHKHFGSADDFKVEAAGRLAWSYRIQGSAAEQIKMSSGKMYREGLMDDGLCLPVTIIHDELVGIIHGSVMEERMPKLIDCVCIKYADMEIDISTTPEVGKNFGSLKKWEKKK